MKKIVVINIVNNSQILNKDVVIVKGYIFFNCYVTCSKLDIHLRMKSNWKSYTLGKKWFINFT